MIGILSWGAWKTYWAGSVVVTVVSSLVVVSPLVRVAFVVIVVNYRSDDVPDGLSI